MQAEKAEKAEEEEEDKEGIKDFGIQNTTKFLFSQLSKESNIFQLIFSN